MLPSFLVGDVSDGFSCRTQIAELSGRRGMHTAEALHMALHSANVSVPAGAASGHA